MTWFPTRFPSRAALLALALAAIGCDRPASKPAGGASAAWKVGNDDCAVQAALEGAPRKLEPVAVSVREPHGGCPALRSVKVSIDMPEMKMGVAPVQLKREAGVWRGELVFTMGGLWRIEAAAADTAGAIRKGTKDVDVP